MEFLLIKEMQQELKKKRLELKRQKSNPDELYGQMIASELSEFSEIEK